jgi:crotonobetainyl-CoA:carnitine CoA-transferase CaiB-like acyl-CoA transferase
MPGPLHGIRVVDFSAVVSGPLAAMWLADQGAEVIKVEAPGLGDVTRGTQRLGSTHHGLNGLFMNCNRGKKALCVDVNTDEGRAVVLDLCRSADVFIQNWRPGVVDRLGLGYDDVRAVNDRLVYVSISGYGPDGPYAQRRVYDPIIQGLSGHVAVQVNPDIPFPDLVRTIVCDKATALTVAQSVCAALLARERGAGGQHLQVPMLDTAISFFFPDGFMSDTLIEEAARVRRPTLAQTYRLQATADGYVTYYVANDRESHGLFRALGHPEWCEDERFQGAARFRNLEALGELLDGAFRTWNTAELMERMVAEDVPCGTVRELQDMAEDPQIAHNGALRVREHPVIGPVRDAKPPVRFSGTALEENPLAPTLGQHTDEVLARLGRDADAVADLRARGIVA